MMRRLAWGAWGAWVGLVLELGYVLMRHSERLTGIWELGQGLLGLTPAFWLLAAVPGCGGGWLAQRLCQARRPTFEWGGVFGAFGLALGYGVGGGRHLNEPAVRWGFAFLVGLGFAGVGWGVAGALRRWFDAPLSPEDRRRSGRLFVAFALMLALGLACVNHRVLVRLYPAFHLGLGAMSLAICGCVAALFLPPSRWAGPTALASFFLALVSLVPQSREASRLDNFRVVLSEGSPNFHLGVRWASALAPPPPLDEAALRRPLGSRRPVSSGFDLRGYDVLLLTVDALRADHLGVYDYARDTSPFIDELGHSGVVFEAAYAPTPHTSYSVTSLMTGKYMRPLLLQGAGADSELWSVLLQGYGYRTAAFYPPAIFFIDGDKFAPLRDKKLGFEYAKIEFAEGDKRVGQVKEYLDGVKAGVPVFAWVHLFGPHEPYEKGSIDFGDRDIDRYDSEVRAADDTIRALVETFRARSPKSIVIVTADHGEEFGEHGGRYHGTSVYEEQIRVPLILQAPGLLPERRVSEPVQTIDLLPTILAGLDVPVLPTIRGQDLGAFLAQTTEPSEFARARRESFAAAETESATLYAKDHFRLICARDTGACQLFDLTLDPGQTRDVSSRAPERFQELVAASRLLVASHGRHETEGLRATGKGFPPAIVAALAGDKSVASEVARFLDDADVQIRRKAADVLFEIGSESERRALSLAFSREDDPETRRYLALALTRLGERAPLTLEVLRMPDQRLRRRAALALAAGGDDQGIDILREYWLAPPSEAESRELLEVFRRLKSKRMTSALLARLKDVRLRPQIAEVLGELGDEDARPFLLAALLEERYVSARPVLFTALLRLGARKELVAPLLTYLGMPDPMPNGLAVAEELGVLDQIGGPKKEDLRRLRSLGDSGVTLYVNVPWVGARRSREPVRLLIWARATRGVSGAVRVEQGALRGPTEKKTPAFRARPDVGAGMGLSAEVSSDQWVQLDLGSFPGAKAGAPVALNVLCTGGAEVRALALIPERDEFPPPPPEPWKTLASDGPVW